MNNEKIIIDLDLAADLDLGLDSDAVKAIQKKDLSRFSIDDVITVGMEMEKKGERLFIYFASVIANSEIRDFFRRFADEEKKHASFLESRLHEAGFFAMRELSPGTAAYTLYQSCRVFDRNRLMEKLAKVRDMATVYDFMIDLELDQVRFYQELWDLTSPDHSRFVDELINEERMHFMTLLQSKNDLGKNA